MTVAPRKNSVVRLLFAAGWLLVALLLALRFVDIEADFPSGVTWSGVLLTDEGWYSNAATRHLQTGDWYLAGDFNPAVNMPLGQLLHRTSFALFGFGLDAARYTAAIASAATVLLAALLVLRHGGRVPALLTALLLSAGFTGFAYSRLAIMEPVGMAFVMAALVLADRAREPRAAAWLAAAAFAGSAAVLVKSTMVFVVPLVIWLAWQRGDTLRRRLDLAILALLVPFFVIGIHHLLAALLFPLDYTYFSLLNVGQRSVENPGQWCFNVLAQLFNLLALGKAYVFTCLLLVAVALAVLPAYRRQPLVQLLLAASALYFASLTLVRYGPPRYFLPLLVPLSALAALAGWQLAGLLSARARGRMRPLAALPLLALAALVLAGSLRIGDYLAHPAYSYRDMATGVADIIRAREGRTEGIVLFGDLADGVAPVTGLRAVNSGIALEPAGVQASRHRPRYVLLHRYRELLEEELQPLGAQLTELGAWDVYGNYHLGERNRRLPSWLRERLSSSRADTGSATGTDDDAALRIPKNIELFAIEWNGLPRRGKTTGVSAH